MPPIDNQDALAIAVEKAFESPWLDGQRLEQLRVLFKDLACAGSRTLVVCTRNTRGIDMVLAFLKAAGLDQHLAAIWNIPFPANLSPEEKAAGLHQQLSAMWGITGSILENHTSPDPQFEDRNGAYRVGSDWHFFTAPFSELPACNGWICKADLLHHVVQNPQGWFPQLDAWNECDWHHFADLTMGSIVLVDDDPQNFENMATGRSVLRRCLVHRFWAQYKDAGVFRLGGIGSRCEKDYAELRKLVEGPHSHRSKAQSFSSETTEGESTASTTTGGSMAAITPPNAKATTRPDLNALAVSEYKAHASVLQTALAPIEDVAHAKPHDEIHI
jgi:hypothetical protein